MIHTTSGFPSNDNLTVGFKNAISPGKRTILFLAINKDLSVLPSHPISLGSFVSKLSSKLISLS